jgi:hypothetical protein
MIRTKMSHPDPDERSDDSEEAVSHEAGQTLEEKEVANLDREIQRMLAKQEDPSLPDLYDDEDDNEPPSPEELERHRRKAEIVAAEPTYTLEEMREIIRRNHQQLIDELDETVEYAVQRENPETPEEEQRLREKFRKIYHPGPLPTYDDEEGDHPTE